MEERNKLSSKEEYLWSYNGKIRRIFNHTQVFWPSLTYSIFLTNSTTTCCSHSSPPFVMEGGLLCAYGPWGSLRQLNDHWLRRGRWWGAEVLRASSELGGARTLLVGRVEREVEAGKGHGPACRGMELEASSDWGRRWGKTWTTSELFKSNLMVRNILVWRDPPTLEYHQRQPQ
jgi:hypothetical protein